MRLSWIAIVLAVLACRAHRPDPIAPPQVVVIQPPDPLYTFTWQCPPNGPCYRWAPCMATDAGCSRY